MKHKNLIYIEVNYSNKEIALFELFIKSLVITTKKRSFDLLVITNDAFKQEIQNILNTYLFQNDTYFLTVPRDYNFEKAGLKTLEVFKFDRVLSYEKILHVRCDIIFQRDIQILFDLPIKDNRLYSYTEEPYNHNSPFYGLQNYTQEDLLYFKTNYIKTFTSSVFMFKPSKEMAWHFQNVRKLADIYSGGNVFSDQCYLNYYFNSKKLSNTKLLEGYIESRNIKTNIEGKPTKHDTLFDIKTVVVNFCGLSYYEEKKLRMEQYIKFIMDMFPCAIKARKNHKAF